MRLPTTLVLLTLSLACTRSVVAYPTFRAEYNVHVLRRNVDDMSMNSLPRRGNVIVTGVQLSGEENWADSDSGLIVPIVSQSTEAGQWPEDPAPVPMTRSNTDQPPQSPNHLQVPAMTVNKGRSGNQQRTQTHANPPIKKDPVASGSKCRPNALHPGKAPPPPAQRDNGQVSPDSHTSGMPRVKMEPDAHYSSSSSALFGAMDETRSQGKARMLKPDPHYSTPSSPSLGAVKEP